MGTGRPQEAEFTLVADIPAGEWVFVGDGIITRPVDVTWEIFTRSGAIDTPIATFQHHFDPLPVGFNAQAFDATMTFGAIAVKPGDQLILRYSGANTDVPMAYIPNGDGFRAAGRIPFIDLP